MKVIFLDIDGVLNSSRSWYAYRHRLPDSPDDSFFDTIAVKLVQELCRVTDSVCVLSSSWWYSWTHEELSKALQLPIVDSTPRSISFRLRGYEIKEWLEENPVESYCIIDDVDEMLEEQLDKFVHVDHYNGLSYEDVKKAENILMNQ